MGRGGDAWTGLLATLAGRAGAETAIAIAPGTPPRRLGSFGVLPAEVASLGSAETLRAGLVAAGYADVQLAETPALLVALAARVPGTLRPQAEALLAGLVLSLRLSVAPDPTRLHEVERVATTGQVAMAAMHELNQTVSALYLIAQGISLHVDEVRAHLPAPGPFLAEHLRGLEDIANETSAVLERYRVLRTDYQRAIRGNEEHVERPGEVNVGDTLRACVRLLKPVAGQRVRLDYVVEPDLPSVPGVRTRLEQAFSNLIVNAIHAALIREAGAGFVAVRGRRDGGEVVVEVVDNGPGIPSEVQARMFEPFFTTKPKELGTGLGLPITREIVEAHGGRIEVDTERGRGATFRVRLPLKAHPAKLDRKPHVLVVDDDERVARAFRVLLGPDYLVSIAVGGEAALRVLTANQGAYDVLVVDLHMPDCDGMELFDAIRTRWPGLERKIVFASGGAYTPASREFLERVPNRCVYKPIDPAEIRPILDAIAAA